MIITKENQFIIDEFNTILNRKWKPSPSTLKELSVLTEGMKSSVLQPKDLREKALIKLINQKFDFNNETNKKLINLCAKFKVYFNYHEKQFILSLLNANDVNDLKQFFANKFKNSEEYAEVIKHIKPIDKITTLQLLNKEIEENPKMEFNILEALFGGYVFNSFDKKAIHNYFSKGNSKDTYDKDYYDFLKNDFPHFFNKQTSLIYLTLDEQAFKPFDSVVDFKNTILELVKDSYHNLDNHSYFAVQIKPIYDRELNLQWDIYSDLVLYAEKFIETNIDKIYFKPQKIQEITCNYIEEIDVEKANFSLANEGFTYIDTFILSDNNLANNQNQPYDLLLLFEKNERDERVVPCPACRSLKVQGNSYPKINVRSWECKNTFCPDKSKYNRGKRYSLSSLLRQEAIEKAENLIPMEHIKKWRLDIVNLSDQMEVPEMLIRHYSLFGDNIRMINYKEQLSKDFGRKIKYFEFPKETTSRTNILEEFHNSAFFHRFLIEKKNNIENEYNNLSNTPEFKVFCGDAFSVLSTIESNSIDGAITSPPYYNAKEYAHWDNIYTYLYDMYNISKQVYRVLKDGGVYLFNIFDYFDNENNVVFSAMGKKRMILGAYTIHLFQKAGFTINNNIIWNKGEIEGKRNNNNGNLSPYYQAPFNAWEHIFVFSKGKINKNYHFPNFLNAKPVFKIIKKKNILGHTAPYPKNIPELLVNNLNIEETILDPFSGSFTTGRTAFNKKIKSINIDYKIEYCKLGISLFEQEFDIFSYDESDRL
ncbi:DNA-methyltransferase [Priestia aryabhattai]|uniref:DNA-methyltransferase n=1 Tax=Priestia aryabhattai TaxID=412384 RepID=UPI003735CE9F